MTALRHIGTLKHTTFRAAAEDLEEIDRRARARGLTRTRYLISSALGRDPWASPSLESLIDHVEALDGRVVVFERQMALARESLGTLGLGFEVDGADGNGVA